MTFGQALKKYIRSGAKAPQAMRQAWRDVRAGRVSPPRPKRRKNPTARYAVKRVESPTHFAPGSFRTVRSGTSLVTVGCPKGQWDRTRRRCKVGTRAQRVLTPKRRRTNPVAEYESPKLVRIYNRVEAITARGHVDDSPAQGYQHEFRSGGPIFGVSKSGPVRLQAGDLVVRRRKVG